MGVSVEMRDLNELVRISRYLILVMFIHNSSPDYLNKKLIYFFQIGSILIIIIAFIEYYSPSSFVAAIGKIYSTSNHTMGMIYGYKRLILTGGDPNVGACIALYFLIFNFVAFLYNKKIFNLVLLLLLFVVLLATSSRTGLLAFMGILIINILTLRGYQLYAKLLISFSMLVLIIFLVPKMEYVVVGYETALDGSNTSLNYRFMAWSKAYEIFGESPILGWGPAKSIHPTIVDGEYFLTLRRYGIVGFVLLISVIYYVPLLFLKYKSRLASRSNDSYILASLTFNYAIAAAVIMVTNNFFSGYRLFVPYIILASITYKEIVNIKGIKT